MEQRCNNVSDGKRVYTQDAAPGLTISLTANLNAKGSNTEDLHTLRCIERKDLRGVNELSTINVETTISRNYEASTQSRTRQRCF